MFIDIKRHNDWTQEQYFAHKALSNSDLRVMVDDPLLLKLKMDGKLKDTTSDAMTLGSAFDDYVLSPEQFKDKWKVIEVGEMPTTDNQKEFVRLVLAGLDPDEAISAAYKKPTMSGEEMYRQFAGFINISARGSGREKISTATMGTIEKMFAKLQRHEHAIDVIANSHHQVCFTGIHEETGVGVKGMLDMLSKDGTTETDLKSTSEKWGRINRFWFKGRMFDTQRAMYCGLSGATETNILVCQTEGVHRTGLFDVTGYLPEATRCLNELINEYEYRVKNDAWEHGIDYYFNGGREYLK